MFHLPPIALATLTGFISGLLLSIPVGPVNLTIMNEGARRGFKWAGVFILLLFAALFWAEPVTPDFVAGTWTFRIGAPAGAVLTLVYLLRTAKEPSLKARLAMIPPAADTVCPFCGTPLLVLASRCSCPGCGVVRS